MPNDAVHLAMRQAARAFGGSDGVFSAAGFGHCLSRIAGLRGGIDGDLVRAILCGRSDVQVLHGGAHFRLAADEFRRFLVEADAAPSAEARD